MESLDESCEEMTNTDFLNTCANEIIIWILILLFILGLIKALLGLCIIPIGIWGIDKIILHPHEIRKYRETELKNKMVVYDDTGWPVHPVTGEKTVRALSRPAEFIVNIFFFYLFPLMLLIKLLLYICCCHFIKPFPRHDSCECFEWVNTIVCSEVTDVEKKNLLHSDRESDDQKRRQKSTSHSKLFQKSRKKTTSKSSKSEVNTSVLASSTRTSATKSSYEDNTDQEREDTQYALDTLQKSKASLKIGKK